MKKNMVYKITALLLSAVMCISPCTGFAADSAPNVKATWDCVWFGNYWQEDTNGDGRADQKDEKKPIRWRVLSVKGDDAFLLADQNLDCQKYNESWTDVTWETCTLRRWLNGTFMSAAFSDEEKSMISTVMVYADKNSDYSTDPGNTTQDQIFLLSITKANKYFSSNSERQCKATAYAEAQGVYVNDDNGNCWWWLRSPGNAQISAALVSNDGDVCGVGLYVNLSNIAVRPALWIDLNKIN